jgi:[protein-PII] uridylyltransferase
MQHVIKSQRAIIDRKALQDRLDGIPADLDPAERRAHALDILKEGYRAGMAEVRRRFDEIGRGTETVREICFLTDQIVRIVHDIAVASALPVKGRIGLPRLGARPGPQVGVVAVGGYGRGELSPHSDIDLLFLMAKKGDAKSEKVVQYILYLLWDMGLKVGHSTRTVKECIKEAKADLTIRTAILEARWLWGDQAEFSELMKRYQTEIVANGREDFVEAKLAERDERHAKLGEARYVLEPNIKDGKGGLRDLHTLYWIAKFIYNVSDIAELVPMGQMPEEFAHRFAKAQAFLWTVRCHLHFLTGRMEDRLTFDMQPEIARRMQYADRGRSLGVERFMKYYFLIAKDVGDLTRIFCAVLEDQHKRRPRLKVGAPSQPAIVEGFPVVGRRIDIESEAVLAKEPVSIIRLFHAAMANDLDIHPHALSLITRNLKRIDTALRKDPDANRMFLDMLTSKKDPERALRLMNESGVLGRFIPDFGRVVAQMQYDMYHVYPVDEHTIQAIGIVSKIEHGQISEEMPAATEIMHAGLGESSRVALYFATFLHDIAKGRNGDHSELGAQIAIKLGARLGIAEEAAETASWLIRYHLLMTRTAYKRDIDDPKTIADFVAIVQSPERLKLLLVLTSADVTAVGPNVWNAWKGGLLRTLYRRALDMMSGGIGVERPEERVAAAQNALREGLKWVWPKERIEAHIAKGYPAYWVSFDSATHLRHALMIREAETSGAPLSIDSRIHQGSGVTEITVYTADHPGLFAKIAGAVALSGASILDAKIITMADGMALDSFLVQDAGGGVFGSSSRLAKLSINIEQALAGKLRLEKEIAARRLEHVARTRNFSVAPRVIVDNGSSAMHTVIEINGRDRIGLLYELTSTMTKLNLQISSAHISTYGMRVVDVFYVKNVFGLKIEHPRKIEQIRAELLEALTLKPPAPAKPAAAPVALGQPSRAANRVSAAG